MTAAIIDSAAGSRRHPDGTFRKRLTADQARREVQGWQAIRDHLPVADLVSSVTDAGGLHVLIYQDVFAAGRCEHLLADLISHADQDDRAVPAVRALVDAVCNSWLHAVGDTGKLRPIGQCRPGLYAARLAPGGRLDDWYGHLRATPVVVDTGSDVVSLHFAGVLGRLRAELAPERGCLTALTQGDPTEPNIAGSSLCWLDYEHAGLNPVAAEAANLLWYLLAMGGWLVPQYKPATYAATVGRRRPALPPAVTHAWIGQDWRRVEVAGQLRAGVGRRAAITALLARLRSDLGHAIGPGDVMDHLWPWLAMRILGVLPLTALADQDAAVCLLKLAQLDGSLADFAATCPEEDT
ncbi:hypothetical protein [Sphaerisporangium sp. TRM90804]|uniref:hypothetical protein n=1 Tax=Sphaerisporangium sp. TRM90804 TaxID=3031113 RepID=UPI002447175F|nr:hypothetical protein [Sphaerisporangium sp. TRM90804]MDH2425803.1 hypothetical protein [Sphaerisporangium sp. TRM90804]